jgi:hypothetical protein
MVTLANFNIEVIPHDFYGVLGYLFIIFSIVFGIRYHNLLKEHIKHILPFTVIGFILVLGLSASNTLGGVLLSDNLTIILFNGYVVVRDSFFAVIGLLLFQLCGIQGKVSHWEKGFSFFKFIPSWLIPSIIVFQFLYSWLIYHIYDVKFWDLSRGYAPRIQEAAMGSLGALTEELLVRLFLIALIIYLSKGLRAKWLIAILLSSIYWSFNHQFHGSLNLMKVVQTFPLGIILGYLMDKYGFEACLTVHLLSNLLFIIT